MTSLSRVPVRLNLAQSSHDCGVRGSQFLAGQSFWFRCRDLPGGPSCPHTGWHCRVEYLVQFSEFSR
jgi:hypothetical protein